MASSYDIGPRIGIDGESEFKKNLSAITTQIRSLGSEMKAVTAEFADNANSMEALTAKSQVLDKTIAATEQQIKTLTSQYDRQVERLNDLGNELDKVIQEYGESSKEASAAQNAYNQQYAVVGKLEGQLNQAQASLAKLNAEQSKTTSQMSELSSASGSLSKVIADQQSELDGLKKAYSDAVLEYGKNSKEAKTLASQISSLSGELQDNKTTLNQASDAANELDKSLDDVGDAADSSSGKLSSMTVAMGNLISSGIQACISAVGNLISSIWNLDEATKEYRIAQGRLNTAFEAAGMSTDAAQTAYTEFYKILGDTDTATEASQLLAQLTENEQDLTTWTRIAAGVSGTFGDSLPIESLIEAANETANVGTVTGVLADALNWVGISEDEFNERLAECSDESERNQLIMEALSEQYDDAADAFYRNNDALVESRENQAELDDTLADVGEAMAKVKNTLLQELTPALTALVDSVDWQAFGQTISNFVSFVIDNGPLIISIIAGIGAGFAAWKITSVISSVITALQGLVPALTGATTAQQGLNIAMNANPFGLIVTGVTAVITIITTLWNTSEGFRNAVTGIWETIKGAFVSAWEAISGAWSAAVGFFQNIWDSIRNTFSGVAETLGGFFFSAWDAITGVWDAATGFFSGIWDGIKNTFSAVPEVLGGFFSSAWDAITGVWDGVTGWFSNLWSDIKNIFSDAGSTFLNIGKNIVNGIKNGISSLWGSLKSWFSGLWNGLVGGVEKLLGMNSPSKVFADIGENMAAGVGVGWDDQFGAIQKDVDKSMASLIPDTSANVSVTGRSGAASVPYDIAGVINSALNGAIVYMDGRKVGKLITRSQNNDIRGAGLVPVS